MGKTDFFELELIKPNKIVIGVLESFRFEDENEDEDEDEALGFRHKEIFKLFRLQQGRDNVVAINFVVPAYLKTKKFEDFVVAKTECFVLVLESKAPFDFGRSLKVEVAASVSKCLSKESQQIKLI